MRHEAVAVAIAEVAQVAASDSIKTNLYQRSILIIGAGHVMSVQEMRLP